jgi:hypothetical protein
LPGKGIASGLIAAVHHSLGDSKASVVQTLDAVVEAMAFVENGKLTACQLNPWPS